MARIPLQRIDVLLLGTAVEITVTFDKEDPTATITIEDEYENTRVDEASMTKLSSTVFQYIFQSDEDWTACNFYATITAVKGEYTGKSQFVFEMRELS